MSPAGRPWVPGAVSTCSDPWRTNAEDGEPPAAGTGTNRCTLHVNGCTIHADEGTFHAIVFGWNGTVPTLVSTPE